MLQTLRNPKYVKTIMFWTLVLIIPAFVAFYGWSQLTGTGEGDLGYAAKVNGEVISYREYEAQYKKYMDQVRETYGDAFNEEMAEQLNLSASVVDSLISQKLVLQEAQKAGVQVTDEEIRQIIQGVPAFQVNGQFNPQAYRQALQSQGKTPEMFEAELRSERISNKMVALVTDFVKVSEPEVREEFRKRNEKLTFDLIRFGVPDYISKVSVTEDAVKKSFTETQQMYALPPQYEVGYAFVDPAAMAASIQVTYQQVSEYYNSEMSKYVIPERISIRQAEIVIPETAPAQAQQAAQQKIQEVSAKLQAGTSFEKATQGLTLRDLGWIERGKVSQQVEQILFSLKPGQSTPGLRVKDGYAVLQVVKHEASRVKPISEVKDQITAAIKTQSAMIKAEDKCQELMSASTGKVNLSEIAAKSGLNYGTSGMFSGKNSPVLNTNKEFLSDLPSMQVGTLLGPYQSEKGLYIVQLLNKVESRIPAYEEVKEQVKARLIYKLAQDAAEKAALQAGKEITTGSTLEQIAAKNSLKVVTMGPHSLIDNIPGLGQNSPLMQTAFYQPIGKTSNVIKVQDSMGQGFTLYCIIRLKDRVAAPESAFNETREQLTKALVNQKKEQAVKEWMTALRKRAKITENNTLTKSKKI